MSGRGRPLPRRGRDSVLVMLRIARIVMCFELNFGEIFKMFGLAEQFPVLERPVGGLLTTEGRQRAVTTYVLHESLPRVHRGYGPYLRQGDGGRAKHLLRPQRARLVASRKCVFERKFQSART
jgi:hypothetical protein